MKFVSNEKIASFIASFRSAETNSNAASVALKSFKNNSLAARLAIVIELASA